MRLFNGAVQSGRRLTLLQNHARPLAQLTTSGQAALFRTYAKLSQQGALPQAVRLYGKAAQRRWGGFA